MNYQNTNRTLLFSTHPRFGDYAIMDRPPLRETYHGIDVQHLRHFNKPLTVTARGSAINFLAAYSIPRRLMRWASNRACAFIGVSRALTQPMAQMGMPAFRPIASDGLEPVHA